MYMHARGAEVAAKRLSFAGIPVQGPETQLVMKGCYLHGVPHSAAVFAEAGRVHMEGRQCLCQTWSGLNVDHSSGLFLYSS